ncbi:MAG: HAD family hydrolase [Oscillospiraceae bacterium]|nr:HAD family hydrolase [Oscillospiraceae bacterium]
MKLKGTIFDFDGTLFDSMSIWDTAGEDYLRSLGCEPSRDLQQQGVKMCIATATDRYQIEAALRRCRMEHYFEDILTCTSVGHSKSEPHIFQAALQRLGTAKEETLVFEDALHAVQTAKSAAFPVAAVFDPHESRQDQVRALADIYLTDFLTLNFFWKLASAL